MEKRERGNETMNYGSEILSIIEGGLEGNEKKVRSYTELLVNKLPDGDHIKQAIKRRLDGSYKNDPVLEAKKHGYFCSQCKQYHQSESKIGVKHKATT